MNLVSFFTLFLDTDLESLPILQLGESQRVLYFCQKCELFSWKGALKSELFGLVQLAGLDMF